MLDDPAQFLAALQDNDKDAWDEFYGSHLQPLRSRLARQFGDLSPEEIDDVSSIVIERVFQKIGTVKVPQALGSWLWKVAKSQAISYVNSRKRRYLRSPPIEDDTLVDDQIEFTEALSDGEAVNPRLQDAFETMSPVHRSLLMMRTEGVPDEVIYHFTGLVPRQQRAILGYVRSGFGSTS
jgi:RNA polymerase sigma factor (sigma-70 family)